MMFPKQCVLKQNLTFLIYIVREAKFFQILQLFVSFTQ
jgi:hypothetical protein